MNSNDEFELEYLVRFVDERIKDVLDDATTSQYLPARMCMASIQYIQIAKRTRGRVKLPPLLYMVSTDFKNWNRLVILQNST